MKMDNCTTHSSITSFGQKPRVMSSSAENRGGLDALDAVTQTGNITPTFSESSESWSRAYVHLSYFLLHPGVCGVVWVESSAVIKNNQQTNPKTQLSVGAQTRAQLNVVRNQQEQQQVRKINASSTWRPVQPAAPTWQFPVFGNWEPLGSSTWSF